MASEPDSESGLLDADLNSAASRLVSLLQSLAEIDDAPPSIFRRIYSACPPDLREDLLASVAYRKPWRILYFIEMGATLSKSLVAEIGPSLEDNSPIRRQLTELLGVEFPKFKGPTDHD